MFADTNSQNRLTGCINVRNVSRRWNVDGDPLIIREFSPTGDFINCIHCAPGTITSIQAKQAAGKLFSRSNLIDPEQSNVRIRLGNRPLHPTDLALVTKADLAAEDRTALACLRAHGVPARMCEMILAECGLADKSELTFSQLNVIDRWKIKVSCAFFTDVPVVVVECPINMEFDQGCERLAKFVLDEAKRSGRIFVIIGLTKIPSIWKNEACFQNDQQLFSPARNTRMGLRRKTSDDVRDHLRKMMRESRVNKRDEMFFVTRAQLVYSRPSSSPEALKAEAILNPALESIEFASDSVSRLATIGLENKFEYRANTNSKSQTRLQQVVEPSKSKRRLTRVTQIERIRRQSPVIRAVSKLASWLGLR